MTLLSAVIDVTPLFSSPFRLLASLQESALTDIMWTIYYKSDSMYNPLIHTHGIEYETKKRRELPSN